MRPAAAAILGALGTAAAAAHEIPDGAVFGGRNVLVEQAGGVEAGCTASGDTLWRVDVRGAEVRFKWTTRLANGGVDEGTVILPLDDDGRFGRTQDRAVGTMRSRGELGLRAGFMETELRRGGYSCRQRVDFLRADVDGTPKQRLIRELVQEVGMLGLIDQLLAAQLPQAMAEIARRAPNLPDAVRQAMQEEFAAEFRLSTGEFIDAVVAIYDRHYTHDDIVAILEFNRSPAGRKVNRTTASIVLESQAAGVAWGRAAGERAARRALAKGRQLGADL